MRIPHRIVSSFVLAIALFLGAMAFTLPASSAEVVQFEVVIVRASRSGESFDKRLLFAKRSLLGTGYKSFAYVKRYSFQLAVGGSSRFPIDGGLSGLLQLKAVTRQTKGEVAQYYLAFYSGKKKQAGLVYSVWKKGAPGIAALPQPEGLAYIVIVRALR
jgi:hypothetical protein